MSVNTLSLSKAVAEVHVDIGFTFETLDTIDNSLDTVKLNGDVVLDRAAVIAKYEEFEAIRPLNELREERNRRLAETDWWAFVDQTMTPEQIAYRQALRDITQNYFSLDNIVWPVKP